MLSFPMIQKPTKREESREEQEEEEETKKGEEAKCHWIGLRENLQETMVFTIKYRGFL